MWRIIGSIAIGLIVLTTVSLAAIDRLAVRSLVHPNFVAFVSDNSSSNNAVRLGRRLFIERLGGWEDGYIGVVFQHSLSSEMFRRACADKRAFDKEEVENESIYFDVWEGVDPYVPEFGGCIVLEDNKKKIFILTIDYFIYINHWE